MASGDPCSLAFGFLKTVCENLHSTVSSATSSGGGLNGVVLQPLADSTASSATSVLGNLLTWWMDFPSVSLDGSGVLGLRPVSLFLASVVGVILLISQALKAIIRRRGTPLLEAAVGVIKLAFWIAVGEGLLTSVLAASDALTGWIKTLGFGNLSDSQVAAAFTATSLQNLPAGDWILVMVIALAMVVIGVIQLALMFCRQAAIPIQAGLIPIAAAGQISSEGATSARWLPKLVASIAGVALYKPMAMFVLAVGYREMATASGIAQSVLGLVTMLLSVIALPSMIRLFAPLVGTAGPSGGSGLLAVAGEALMLRRMSGDGGSRQGSAAGTGAAAQGPTSSAATQASAMNNSGPAAATGAAAAAKTSPAAAAATGAAAAAGTAPGATTGTGSGEHTGPQTAAGTTDGADGAAAKSTTSPDTAGSATARGAGTNGTAGANGAGAATPDPRPAEPGGPQAAAGTPPAAAGAAAQSPPAPAEARKDRNSANLAAAVLTLKALEAARSKAATTAAEWSKE